MLQICWHHWIVVFFQQYLYFLTHLHTDHTQGLTSTWTEPIYTSELNAELVISMLKVNPSLVIPLEIGTTIMIDLPSAYGTEESQLISVTPIDANHIKGSVMFLFEGRIYRPYLTYLSWTTNINCESAGRFGKILHTGDFRLCDSMLQNPTLKMISESEVWENSWNEFSWNWSKLTNISWQSLDLLYVDNTFEETGNEFPVREQAMQEVMAIVR